MRIKWNDYFMIMAKIAAMRSGCNSRPTGAVAVIGNRIVSTGYNGSVPGKAQCTDKGSSFCYRRSVDGPEDDKYNICPSVHAEANVINQAALMGVSLNGAILYCTLSPCYVCLKSLRSSGVWRVLFEYPYESSNHERDSLWHDFDSIGIKGEQYTISDESIKKSFETIANITSKRRL